MPPILFPKPVTMPPDDDDDDSKTSDIRPTPETVDDDQSSQKQQPFYDVVLFIGMAAGRNYYTLEAVAHRDGHLLPDNDIKNMQGDTFWKDLGGPGLLKTTFDTDDVWRRWKSELMVSLLKVRCVVGSSAFGRHEPISSGEEHETW